MTRRRAWLMAALTTVSVAALVVGIGATFGQFGFGESRGEASGVVAEGSFSGNDVRYALPGLLDIDEDEAAGEEGEHEWWEGGEHEREEHEWEGDEEHEREEHEDEWWEDDHDAESDD